MRISNTTKLSTTFIRRMVSWCAKQVGLPVKKVREVHFRNRHAHGGVNGLAWYRSKILVRFPEVGIDEGYDQIVFVTAHELQHLLNWHDGSDSQLRQDRDLEPHCNRVGRLVEQRFAENRAALLAAWSKVPERVLKAATRVRDPIAERAAKAKADLERWERKLKLAKTKVAKYRAKVKRYEKRQQS